MKKIFQIVFPLVLGIFLCFFAYKSLSSEQLQEIQIKLNQINYNYFLLSVFLGVLSHFSRAYRWSCMLATMGYHPKKPNMIMAVFIGYLVNLTIPRSGEVSRSLVLTRYEGIDFDKSFGTIIAERIIDMIILLLLTLVVLCVQYDVLKVFIFSKIPLKNLLVLVSVLCICGVAIVYWIFSSSYKIAKRLSIFILGVKQGMVSVLQINGKLKFFFHTFFIWAMYIMMFYVAFFALKETSDISFKVIFTAFVVGSFSITFTNGGLGAYPLFIAGILSLYGVDYAIGTALGWVMWISQFLMMLIFGVFSLLALPLYNHYFNLKRGV